MNNYAKKIKLSNRTVYIINDDDIVLQSYNAFVARIHQGRLILGPLWDYSPTTWQHVRKFISDYTSKLDWLSRTLIREMFVSKNYHKAMQEFVANNIIPVIDNVGLRQGEN